MIVETSLKSKPEAYTIRTAHTALCAAKKVEDLKERERERERCVRWRESLPSNPAALPTVTLPQLRWRQHQYKHGGRNTISSTSTKPGAVLALENFEFH